MPFTDDPQSDVGRLLDYVQIVRRRKGTLILLTLLGVLTSLLVSLPQTPVYQARASIEIQNLNKNFLNMRNVSPTGDEGDADPRSDLQTQVKLLQSESLLDRVVTKLDLEHKLFPNENSGQFSAWRMVLGVFQRKPESTRERTLALVRNALQVSSGANTRIVEIRYDSTNAKIAADFVNTLTSEFIQQNLESRWKVTQQTGEWLRQQMEEVRLKLENSDEQLQSYAKASGLVFTSEKDNVTDETLRQLQQELSAAQADRVATQSKYELVSTASAESLPAVLDDPTIKEYQVKLTDLRRQLAEISSSLTPAHPAVKKVQAQVTTLELALEKERSNVIERLRNDFQSAQRRERLLAARYDAQARVMSEQAAQVAHYGILKREVDTNRQLYDSLLQNVQQASMTSALGASNIRVVDSGAPPTRPYKPRVMLNLTLGLFAGAFFGFVLVVVQERANRTIRVPGDTTLYLQSPELGAIPSATAHRRLLRGYQTSRTAERSVLENRTVNVELVASSKKTSLLSDSFKATATSVLYSGANGERPRLIVITSANPGEGKTTIATNLALALAEVSRSGFEQSVLLVDADLRKPRLHEIFGVPNRCGLGDLLEGTAPPSDGEALFLETEFSNLFLLPSGSSTVSTAALLHSPRAIEYFHSIRSKFFAVVIDTPPMLFMPEARILGRIADGVILVTSSGHTMMDAAVAANQRLTDDGAYVLGTILNKWDPRTTNASGYGDTYKYYRDLNGGMPLT